MQTAGRTAAEKFALKNKQMGEEKNRERLRDTAIFCHGRQMRQFLGSTRSLTGLFRESDILVLFMQFSRA
jgi:hypothetical protein